MNSKLKEIGETLRTQDNRITAHPMFCVQKLVADTGYDVSYSEEFCWWSAEECEVVFEAPEGWIENGPNEQDGWEKFGYKERWETVMVAFTQKGCEEYLDLNGHNVKRSAHKGEVRIYAESFYRCPEMIAIREALMELSA